MQDRETKANVVVAYIWNGHQLRKIAPEEGRQLEEYFCVFKTTLRSFGNISKRLRNQEIDSKESIPPAYIARRTGTSNRVVVPAHQAGIDSGAP